MKRIVVVVGLVFLLLTLTGCGAFFGNSAQWERENWYGLATADDVARMKQDKLAVKKLESLPAQGTPTEGYRGVVANLSSYNRYNFRLEGPEEKSYLLGPAERAVDYLIPGNYLCTVYRGGERVGEWKFKVGPQQQNFLNEKYHWYVYTEW